MLRRDNIRLVIREFRVANAVYNACASMYEKIQQIISFGSDSKRDGTCSLISQQDLYLLEIIWNLSKLEFLLDNQEKARRFFSLKLFIVSSKRKDENKLSIVYEPEEFKLSGDIQLPVLRFHLVLSEKVSYKKIGFAQNLCLSEEKFYHLIP